MNSFQIQVIFLGVFLSFVILFSLSSVEPVPYRDNSVFSKEISYSEGFAKKIHEAITKQTDSSTNLEGLEGLKSSSYGSEKPMDEFSRLPSSIKCEPSPYSTSLGYVCLDEHAKKMLSTRGGNQTGSPSQIGN